MSATLALFMLPALASAQEPGWRFSVAGEAGYLYPTRALGKSVGNLQENTALQATAKIDGAPLVGGAVEAALPGGSLVLRLAARTTMGARATGQLGVCNVVTGLLCQPFRADARMRLGMAEVLLSRGSPEQAIRPVLIGGLGARTYSFTVPPCPEGTDDQTLVCEMIGRIYEEPDAVQPFLVFGVGLDARAGPLSFFIRLQDVAGEYVGGTGSASGDFQNDIVTLVGASLRLR